MCPGFVAEASTGLTGVQPLSAQMGRLKQVFAQRDGPGSPPIADYRDGERPIRRANRTAS